MNSVTVLSDASLDPLFQQWSQFLTGAAHASVWRASNGPPASNLGADGDFYLDIITGDVYIRGSGIYNLSANLRGPAGPAGPAGAAGPASVSPYATASLPTPGTAGRLAKLTDATQTLVMDTGSQWFDVPGGVYNVKAFGAKGDGITDDTNAIRSAITSLLANSTAGGHIQFPPGKYLISSTIDLSQKNSIELRGAAPASTGSPAASRLIYTANNTSSMFTLHGIRNIYFRNLGLEWNNASYTGTLIDYSQSTATGNTAYGGLIDCHVMNTGSGVRTGPAYLVNCDSGFGFNFIRTIFWGGQYAILGRANSSSFNNCTSFDQCNFEYSTNPPILNPHQSWIFRACVFEPIALNVSGSSFGPAGAITFLSGCPCNGLTLSDCWIGDDLNTSTGTWITLIGNCQGVQVLGGRIGCSQSTTGIKITGNNCSLNVSGVAWAVGGGSSIGIDFGTTTGHSFTSKRCGNWTNLATAINLGGNSPNTTFISADYETGGAITIVNAAFSGNISATNITASNAMTATMGTFGNISPNLLTQSQADFENSVAGWASDNAAQSPFTAFATPLALHGGYVFQVATNSNVAVELGVGLKSGSSPGYSYVVGTPNTTYYGQASFRAPSGQPVRLPNIELNAYDSTGTLISTFATANNLTKRETTTGWLTLYTNGNSPTGTAFIGIIAQWHDYWTITHVNVVSNTCTVTVSATHDLINDQLVDITALTTTGTTGINGTNYTVANVTSTTFQITTTGVANINTNTNAGFAKGHLTIGETHWLDCVQISTQNTFLWEIPGNLSVNTSGGPFGSSVNLLTQDQADFEGASVAGWKSSNSAVLAITTSAHLNGLQCLQCTTGSSITNEMSIYMGTGSAPAFNYVAASPATLYYAVASFLLPGGGTPRTINLSILAYDSTGTQIGTSGFAITNNLVTKDNSSTWTKLTCNGLSPSGTAYVGLFVQWHDSYAIVSVSASSNVATLTTSINHDLTVGQVIKVASCTNTQFNGSSFTITATTSNTFSYALTTADLTATSDTSGNVKGNMPQNEVHYLDCAQLSSQNTTLWSLPGTASVSPAAGIVQASSGSDLVVGANGSGVVTYISPIGTGTGGTVIGDGNGGNALKVYSGHVLLTGATPTITAGSGAGTSPTVSISGSDQAGVITITTGSGPSVSATVATVTFGIAFATTPQAVILTPGGPNAAGLSGASMLYEDSASRSTTAFVLKVGSSGLAATTTYLFNYQVMG